MWQTSTVEVQGRRLTKRKKQGKPAPDKPYQKYGEQSSNTFHMIDNELAFNTSGRGGTNKGGNQ